MLCDAVIAGLRRQFCHFGNKYTCFNVTFHWNKAWNNFFELNYSLNQNAKDLNRKVCWHAQSCECSLLWIDSKDFEHLLMLYKAKYDDSKFKKSLRILISGKIWLEWP